MKRIYLDNAATTPLLPEVKAAITEHLETYGNPSSLYAQGIEARKLIEESRRIISKLLDCPPEECYFTSGASESNAWALKGAAALYRKYHGAGGHIITTLIEHHSILETCKYLQDYCGVEITYVGINEKGFVNVENIQRAVRPDTFLISVMGANNEIGTIQPIQKIARIAAENGILYHCDATQLFGKANITLVTKDVDLLSVSAHKVGGLKGTGLLRIKSAIKLPSLIHGTQESGLRGGTENALGIIAFGEAVRALSYNMYDRNQYVWDLTYHMHKRIEAEIPGAKLNGKTFPRVPGNLNYTFPGVRGEELAAMLDLRGIAVSTGSACNSSSNEPSHVLLALGLSSEEANSSVRFSISAENTYEEIDCVVDTLIEIIPQLRREW